MRALKPCPGVHMAALFKTATSFPYIFSPCWFYFLVILESPNVVQWKPNPKTYTQPNFVNNLQQFWLISYLGGNYSANVPLVHNCVAACWKLQCICLTCLLCNIP